MKITISVDCTPEEARTFFGLPDVRAMHEAVVARMTEQMQAGLQGMTAETLIKAWLQSSTAGLDQALRAFGERSSGKEGSA